MTIIRQKITPAPAGDTAILKAWRSAVIRAIRDTIGLDTVITQGECTEISGVPAPHPSALMLGIGDAGVASGALLLSQPLFAAIVEWQMTGRLSAHPPDRMPTRTDSVLCHDAMECALAHLAEQADTDLAGPLGPMEQIIDPDTLRLMFEERRMRRLDIHMMIGGRREATLTLLLPLVAAAPVNPAERFQADLGAQVMLAETTLNAVLCRMTTPLGGVLSLQVGAVLPLNASTDDIRFETPCGKTVAQGHLGQNKGMRAVRLGNSHRSDQTRPA